MNKKEGTLKILSYVLGVLLIVSVFKNISYPLMWGDECTTTMGSERVVKYGYPKAHDGKNVLNDMFCRTPKVAVNAKDDAFIGGANWGQYYFGTIGYLLADKTSEIYIKTCVYRSTFAIIGLFGLFLLVFVMSKIFLNKFYKYLFIALFLLTELISISMVLHLRQVRYYPLALFFSTLVMCLYVLYRYYSPFNKIFFSIVLSVLLWILFNMFSPLYFIFILAIGISETVMVVIQYVHVKKLKEALMPCLPALIAIVVSFTGIYPLLEYFKTFEMKKMLDNSNHFTFTLYLLNFSNELRYFSKLDLLWLAVALKSGILINYKKILRENSQLFKVSNFLSLVFIISLFLIPDIPNAIFTRYIIYMQPVLSIITIFDFFLLLKIFSSKSKKIWNVKVSLLIIVCTGLFGFTFAENLPYINGHIYEMTHQYKGSLDYTIPYIQSSYQRTDTLIIAANCEEAPFMYYLKSKVIVGVVGNNLPEDTLFQPDIIAYKQSVGSFFPKVFDGFVQKASYKIILFPGKDTPNNDIPELNNDLPGYNHYFKSLTTDNKLEEVNLVIKK